MYHWPTISINKHRMITVCLYLKNRSGTVPKNCYRTVLVTVCTGPKQSVRSSLKIISIDMPFQIWQLIIRPPCFSFINPWHMHEGYNTCFVICSFVHLIIMSIELQRSAITSMRQLEYEQANGLQGFIQWGVPWDFPPGSISPLEFHQIILQLCI